MITSFIKRFLYINNIIRYAQIIDFKKFIKKNSDEIIADIGCGDGYLLAPLKNRYSYYYAVEPSEIYKKINKNQKVKVLNESSANISIKNNSIDTIILSSVIQMVRDDSFLLSECNRILKNDGRILMTFPSEYILIKSKYKFLSKFFEFFNKEFPLNYPEFKKKFNEHYKNSKGFYDIASMELLAKKNNFKVINKKHNPGLLISYVHDISMIFKLFFGKRISISKHLLIFFPLAYLDFMFFNNVGNEIFVELKKVKNNE